MILDRYLGRSLIITSLLAMFVLVAVFSFFSLVDQLDDTGVGNYGVSQAIQYVLLGIPTLSYQLFPIAPVLRLAIVVCRFFSGGNGGHNE